VKVEDTTRRREMFRNLQKDVVKGQTEFYVPGIYALSLFTDLPSTSPERELKRRLSGQLADLSKSFIIGTDKDPEPPVMNRLISYAVYWANPRYRDEVKSLFRENSDILEDHLSKWSEDELQALLISSVDEMSYDLFILARELRSRMLTGFEAYFDFLLIDV
jgi:hypothetical protein